MWRVLRGCRTVFMGIPYSGRDVIVLSWLLRLVGVRVCMMSDPKFDDMPRNVWFELVKSLLLTAYRGALVAGRRQVAYLHFLRFRRRPVLMGYDVVSGDRLRALAARSARRAALGGTRFPVCGAFCGQEAPAAADRAYAAYVAQAGEGRGGWCWRALAPTSRRCAPGSPNWGWRIAWCSPASFRKRRWQRRWTARWRWCW
jgi:hypothetical protein